MIQLLSMNYYLYMKRDHKMMVDVIRRDHKTKKEIKKQSMTQVVKKKELQESNGEYVN